MPTPLEVEAMFAGVGLLPILEAKPRLSQHALQTAADWSKVTRRRILRFLSSDAFDPAADFPPLDYPEVLALVSTGQTPAQTQALFAAVPDHELATDMGLLADSILQWANGALPRSPPNPVTNMPVDDPGPAPVADFRRAWNVLCDPRTVLDDLCDGSLIDDQVATLQQLFPALYQDMRAAQAETVATMVSRRGASWEPTPTKAALLATLMQRSDFDPSLSAAMQQVYATEPGQTFPPPAQASRGAPGVGDMAESTPGNKASAGQ